MYLNEANPGDVLIVKSLEGVDLIRRSPLRDLGLYEYGLIYVDWNENGTIGFHKDSITVSIALDEASKIEVCGKEI